MTERRGARTRRFENIAWGACLVTIVLLLPIARFYFGDSLKLARPGASSGTATDASAPVKDLGRAYDVTRVRTFHYGSGPDDLAAIENRSLDVVTRLEIILPTKTGGLLVVDRPVGLRGEGRVRRYDTGGRPEASFRLPVGTTMYASDAANGLWYVIADPLSGAQSVVHLGDQGEEMRRYPLPEGFLARRLEIAPSGDVYAFAEEWLLDQRAGVAKYEPVLLPVAKGPKLDPPQDVKKEILRGSFFDPKGRLYKVEARLKLQSDQPARFLVQAYDEPGGRVVERFEIGRGYLPVCADGAGRVIAIRDDEKSGSVQGQATLGDVSYPNLELRAYTSQGTFASAMIAPARYLSNWASPVYPTGGDSLQVNVARAESVGVLRLTPTPSPMPLADARVKPAELEIISAKEPDTGDPYAAGDEAQRDLFRIVYRGMVRFDRDLRPSGDLAEEVPSAENGGVSADGLTITYRLAAGSRWHDGRAVTAADVVATWRYLIAEHGDDRSRPFPGFDLIRSVSTRGDDVVVIRLSEPFGAAGEAFFPYVLPAHLIEGRAATPRFLAAPIGTGPYEIVRWEGGKRWSLAAVDRATPIQRIDVRFADAEAAAARIQTATRPTVWTWVPPQRVDVLRRDAIGEVVTTPTGRVWAAVFNSERPQLRNAEVRRLLAAAYPLERLEATVFRDVDESSTASPYGRGKRLDGGGDAAALRTRLPDAPVGLRGRRISATVSSTARDGLDEVTIEQLEEIMSAWEKVGANAEREVFRPRFYGTWWAGGFLTFQDYDVAVGVLPGAPDAAWSGLFDPADTPGSANPLGMNITRTDDPRLRSLYAEARRAQDPGRRAEIAGRITDRVAELGLAVFERNEKRATALVGGVRGYAPARYPAGDFHNIASWSLEER